MNAKHTPAPWSFEKEWDGKSIVAQVATPGNAIYVVGPDRQMRKTDEGIANARLIASAPELLECLKDARRLLTDQDAIDLVHLDEVIAKAEGAVA